MTPFIEILIIACIAAPILLIFGIPLAIVIKSVYQVWKTPSLKRDERGKKVYLEVD